MEGPPLETGTWHEKRQNHGRSPAREGTAGRQKGWPACWRYPAATAGGCWGYPPRRRRPPALARWEHAAEIWRGRPGVKNKARQFAPPGLDFERVILEARVRTTSNERSSDSVENTGCAIGLDSNEIVGGGATGVLYLQTLEGKIRIGITNLKSLC